MGVRRSSSSRRGRARAANYTRCKNIFIHWQGIGIRTSSPFSSLVLKPASTMLICSLTGTYAFPAFTSTLRPSTSSDTVSKSTLNQPPSSTSCRFSPGVAFCRSVPNAFFSSSETTSQSSCKDSTNACLSLTSSP